MKNFFLTLAILAATLTTFGQTMSREAAALVARGDSCMLMNDTYNSMLCYEQANQLGRNDTVMHKLAQCYFKRGQYVKSLALTDTLMTDTILYQHIKLRYNCLQKMGADDSLRIECGQRLVSINPMDAAVVADIATYYNGKQSADTALSYCRAYYALDSTNQQVNKQMGRALFIKKDYYPALDLFLEAYKNGDENPATLFYIGRTYECCSIPDKAHDFILMAAEKSNFASLPIVKALARVSNFHKYRDDVLYYTKVAFELCQADSASMAEVYDIQANFYEAYFYHYYNTDNQKARTCVANQLRSLKSALSYEPTITRQYNMAVAYGRIHDRDNERLWLQKIKDSDLPRTKANRSIFEYVDYRLEKLKEDEFFEGGKKTDNGLEIVEVED
jgi:tetratricopeptide (TPR) repeat protein